MAYRLHQDAGDLVGVGIRRRPAVLEVAVALGAALARDADGAAAVGHAVRELVDAAGLMSARQA